MTQEFGTIETVDREWAWVKTQRKSACAHCGHKDHCQMVEGEDRMLVKAKNAAAGREGDEVELYLSAKTQLKCVFMVYMVPVIGLIVGAFLGNGVSPHIGLGPNVGIFLFAAAGLVGAFMLTRRFANRMETKNALTPLVKRVVKRSTT